MLAQLPPSRNPVIFSDYRTFINDDGLEIDTVYYPMSDILGAEVLDTRHAPVSARQIHPYHRTIILILLTAFSSLFFASFFFPEMTYFRTVMGVILVCRILFRTFGQSLSLLTQTHPLSAYLSFTLFFL